MRLPKRHNYFLILFDLYTIVVWLLLAVEFFSKEKLHLPTLLTSVYLIILTFYASDKEIRRWRKRVNRHRHGEIFVYLWLLTLIVVVGCYLALGKDNGYVIPGDLPTIAGSVLIIYIITDYLKEEFRKKT